MGTEYVFDQRNVATIKERKIIVNFQVYEKNTEKVVNFKLFNDNGNIVLAVVDKNGKILNHGKVVRITSEGKLVFYSRLNPNTGLRVKIDSVLKSDWDNQGILVV